MKMAIVQKSPKVKEIQDYYVGDFETPTTNTKHFMSGAPGRILCLAIQKLGDFNNFVLKTHTMEDFETWLLSLTNNSLIFFHNISFDGLVIADWARNRWNNPLNTNPNHPITWHYKSVRGKILVLILKIINPQTKQKIFVKIQCSFRLLMQSVGVLGSVVQMPKLVAQTYDLEPVDHLEQLPADFIKYMEYDVIIVNKALCQFKEAIGQINKQFKLEINWDRLTSASISRQIIKALDQTNGFKVSFDTQQAAGPYYRGGFTALNQGIKDQILTGKHQIIDAKSHYPSVIYLNDLPVGTPTIYQDSDNLKIINHKLKNANPNIFKNSRDFVTIKGIIKKSLSQWGSIPWDPETKQAHPLYETYIVTEQPEPFTFKGTIREWLEAKKFYEFNYWEVTEWVVFSDQQRSSVLKPMIKYLYDFKEVKDQFGFTPWKMTFKIILNSIYGSMGMDENFDYTVFINNKLSLAPEMHFDKTNALYYDIFFDQMNFFKDLGYQTLKTRKEFTDKELNYSYWNRWIACYITSIGRAELLKLIAMDFDKIYYCDTDSIIGTADNQAFKWLTEQGLIGQDMGQWDYELTPDQVNNTIRFRAPKNYDIRLPSGTILKQGTVGVNKVALNQMLMQDPDFLDHNTIIPDGWKHMVYGIPRDHFEYNEQGNVVLKKFDRSPLKEKTDFFPYIISQDKKWSKLQQQREERTRGN